jgi:hypothetical protein
MDEVDLSEEEIEKLPLEPQDGLGGGAVAEPSADFSLLRARPGWMIALLILVIISVAFIMLF